MTLSRKLAILIIEKNISVEDVVASLRKYNLVGLLPAIQEGVKEIFAHKKTSDTLSIEAPFPLSEEAVLHIKSITKLENISHEVSVNKNILAGFKARFKGKLYDGSAERIIKQLTN